MELWGLEYGGIFSIQASLLDISHLLHKTGFVKTESVGTVSALFIDRLLLCHLGFNLGANNNLDRSSNSPENLAPGIVQKSGLIVQTPSYNSLDPYSYNNPDMFQ